MSKWLLAMRAVRAHTESGGTFLGKDLVEAFDVANDLDLPSNDSGLNGFSTTTIEHLLRHNSGWFPIGDEPDPGEERVTYDYINTTFDLANRPLPLRLPLLPGDFRDFVIGSELDFVKRRPGTKPGYSNTHFLALSEALSYYRKGRFDQYVALMNEYWELTPGWSIVTPPSKLECLLAGEVPFHHVYPGLRRATITAEESAGLRPYQYAGGKDLPFASGFGFRSMSMTTLAGILARHSQTLPSGPKRLLTDEELELLATTAPEDPTQGLAAKVKGHIDRIGPHFTLSKLQFNKKSAQMLWHNGVDYAGGGIAAHILVDSYEPVGDGGSQQLNFTIAIASNTGLVPEPVEIDKIYSILEDIEAAGEWTNDDDLFPVVE